MEATACQQYELQFDLPDPYGVAVPTVRSPLNYIGGKYKLLNQILPLFPQRVRTFFDLFCGGCNVGINVNADTVIFNDNLTFLIDLYKTFQCTSTSDIIAHIEGRIERIGLSDTNADGYRRLRSLYNEARNPLDLFVLVAYSFNHQIRFNSAHQFNNPFGTNRSSFNATMKRNLLRFLERLHSGNYLFTALNFDEFVFSGAGIDDLVYCDPPYLITTGTYNDGKRGFTGWNEREEMKLLSLLSRLDSRGVRFALSNVLSHKGRTNDLLADWALGNGYIVNHLRNNYANSSYHTADRSLTATDEVVITNYNPA